MRASGVRGLLIYCSDYRCSHSTAISGERGPDHVRLSNIEARFTCQACGSRGADVRPDFDWDEKSGIPYKPGQSKPAGPGLTPGKFGSATIGRSFKESFNL
jgi:hypothetical protein